MGELGPHEGRASAYAWRWYDSARGLLPWLALIAAVVGIKANRDPRTLLLLIPLALVYLVYLLVLFGLSLWIGSSMDSSGRAQFDLLFYPLAISVTLLWLVIPAFARRPAAARTLAAIVLVLGVAGLAVISYGTASSDESMMFLAFLGLLGAALVLTPAAAARLSGRSYRPVVFMLWLAVWLIVGGVLAVLGFLAVLVSMNAGPSVSELPGVIVQGLVVGAIMGLFLYALHLPYMLLGFASPFFRTRLQACLNLQQPGGNESK